MQHRGMPLRYCLFKETRAGLREPGSWDAKRLGLRRQELEIVAWEPKERWSLEEGSQRRDGVRKQQGAWNIGIYAWKSLLSCPLISGAFHWPSPW